MEIPTEPNLKFEKELLQDEINKLKSLAEQQQSSVVKWMADLPNAQQKEVTIMLIKRSLIDSVQTMLEVPYCSAASIEVVILSVEEVLQLEGVGYDGPTYMQLLMKATNNGPKAFMAVEHANTLCPFSGDPLVYPVTTVNGETFDISSINSSKPGKLGTDVPGGMYFYNRAVEEAINQWRKELELKIQLKKKLYSRVVDFISCESDLIMHAQLLMKTLVDLKEYMVEDTNLKPSFLKCNLSNGVMSDPVLLRSGETYQRNRIEIWLRRGFAICPKTDFTLEEDEILIPNKLLYQMFINFKVKADKCTLKPKHEADLQISRQLSEMPFDFEKRWARSKFLEFILHERFQEHIGAEVDTVAHLLERFSDRPICHRSSDKRDLLEVMEKLLFHKNSTFSKVVGKSEGSIHVMMRAIRESAEAGYASELLELSLKILFKLTEDDCDCLISRETTAIQDVMRIWRQAAFIDYRELVSRIALNLSRNEPYKSIILPYFAPVFTKIVHDFLTEYLEVERCLKLLVNITEDNQYALEWLKSDHADASLVMGTLTLFFKSSEMNELREAAASLLVKLDALPESDEEG